MSAGLPVSVAAAGVRPFALLHSWWELGACHHEKPPKPGAWKTTSSLDWELPCAGEGSEDGGRRAGLCLPYLGYSSTQLNGMIPG